MLGTISAFPYRHRETKKNLVFLRMDVWNWVHIRYMYSAVSCRVVSGGVDCTGH